MKKLFKTIVAMFFVVMLAFTPSVANAKELSDDTVLDSELGELVAVIDYGDGFVGYQYVKTVAPLGGMQLMAVANRTATVTTKVNYQGVHTCTVTQTASFQYGRPDNIVTVSSASGSVTNASSTTEYYASGASTTKANGSPAVVTTSVSIYKRSTGAYTANLSVYMNMYNDGSVG